MTIDAESSRGDLVVDFQKFERFPLPDTSADAIYGSHVFEHISIYRSQTVFDECARVLKKGGVLRAVLPDVVKSIEKYLAGDWDFELFERRRDRAASQWGLRDYTLFDCLREDFLSRSGQAVLGQQALAHQNAWDFESFARDLGRAGFSDVYQSTFMGSDYDFFSFEGTYPSEANEYERSLYVEAVR